MINNLYYDMMLFLTISNFFKTNLKFNPPICIRLIVFSGLYFPNHLHIHSHFNIFSLMK